MALCKWMLANVLHLLFWKKKMKLLLWGLQVKTCKTRNKSILIYCCSSERFSAPFSTHLLDDTCLFYYLLYLFFGKYFILPTCLSFSCLLVLCMPFDCLSLWKVLNERSENLYWVYCFVTKLLLELLEPSVHLSDKAKAHTEHKTSTHEPMCFLLSGNSANHYIRNVRKHRKTLIN